MTIRYPDGREYTPDNSAIKPRTPKEQKERRISAPGENSQFAVRMPAKDSPLRTMAAVFENSGWQTEYIKFPCQCQDWQNKGANAVVTWREMEHLTWCVCEIQQMSEQQMSEIVKGKAA